MAHISLALPPLLAKCQKDGREPAWIARSPGFAAWIAGEPATFQTLEAGGDAVAAVGYVCAPEAASMSETLARLLASFRESDIPVLKRKLLGEYVMLVKKGDTIWLFTDFIGARNLFYATGRLAISSSFQQAESLAGTSGSDLDQDKVLEFLAMKEVLYPTWLGPGTCHRRIRWLLPYEYLVVDTRNSAVRVGSVVCRIDNHKVSDCDALAADLLTRLSHAIERPEFREVSVGATLTGGHDSRLVAGIAAQKYRNIRFRIAVSSEDRRSQRDLAVAQRVAAVKKIPLDVYAFDPQQHDERFREQTEGFSPRFNHAMAPLLERAGSYSIGFGGVFGTELFLPLPWPSLDAYLRYAIERAKPALTVSGSFWRTFEEALRAQVRGLKEHYVLAQKNDHDQIRLLLLLDTARYASFILSAFNTSGRQLDPYGGHDVFALAFRIAPELWGNHRRFAGKSWVQKAAMARLDPAMGRVMSYQHYRPMLPLTLTTAFSYVGGALQQGTEWLKGKGRGTAEFRSSRPVPAGIYISNGWEGPFIDRLHERYGLAATA